MNRRASENERIFEGGGSLGGFPVSSAGVFGVPSMRRPLALLLVIAAAGAASFAQARPLAPAGPRATFVITGHGWGHGVGMSQYGAYGYAQHGFGYARILAHYFPGTELSSAGGKVRVLLSSGTAKLKIGSVDDFTVRDGDGTSYDVTAGTYTLTAALKLKVDGAPKAQALTPPLLFQPGAGALTLDRPYRGAIQVDVDSGKLRAINVVGLEQYLYGVVPSEMPYTWAPEALKAQAVAARSYALATKRSGAFDVYKDTRSQVYLGLDHEKPSTNAAVDATSGKVLTYDGAIAKTYFFSTSGGRTASSQDVWGTAVPYLVSVPDPYDTISPYHTWGPFAFTGTKLGRMLRLGGAVSDVRTTVNSSGRVTTLTAVTPAGERSMDAAKLRTVLKLRSTWFTVGVLSLTAPTTPVTFGSTTRLSGVARGVRPVQLQQRSGGAWQLVAGLKAAKDGSINIAVKPTATTQYRLATVKVAAAATRVAVAPFVRLSVPRTPRELTGIMRPVLPGTTVAIQREQGSTWTTVANTTVGTSGTFDAQFQLTAGTYRARVAPGHGLVPGVSPVLLVSVS
jgi:stage II sporulation protein D